MTDSLDVVVVVWVVGFSFSTTVVHPEMDTTVTKPSTNDRSCCFIMVCSVRLFAARPANACVCRIESPDQPESF